METRAEDNTALLAALPSAVKKLYLPKHLAELAKLFIPSGSKWDFGTLLNHGSAMAVAILAADRSAAGRPSLFRRPDARQRLAAQVSRGLILLIPDPWSKENKKNKKKLQRSMGKMLVDAAAQLSDVDAFERVYGPPVISMAAWFVNGCPHRCAKDLVQATWVALIKWFNRIPVEGIAPIPNFFAQRPFDPWVRGIAKRTMNAQPAEGANHANAGNLLQPVANPVPPPFVRESVRLLLRDMLDRLSLPTTQRQILNLKLVLLEKGSSNLLGQLLCYPAAKGECNQVNSSWRHIKAKLQAINETDEAGPQKDGQKHGNTEGEKESNPQEEE